MFTEHICLSANWKMFFQAQLWRGDDPARAVVVNNQSRLCEGKNETKFGRIGLKRKPNLRKFGQMCPTSNIVQGFNGTLCWCFAICIWLFSTECDIPVPGILLLLDGTSIGTGKFGPEKRYRKNVVPKKVPVSVLERIWYQYRKIAGNFPLFRWWQYQYRNKIGPGKKYRYRKKLVPKKCTGTGKNSGCRHTLVWYKFVTTVWFINLKKIVNSL